MAQKRHSVDQIISKLRRADVELGKGKKVHEVCKLIEIKEQTYGSDGTYHTFMCFSNLSYKEGQ